MLCVGCVFNALEIFLAHGGLRNKNPLYWVNAVQLEKGVRELDELFIFLAILLKRFSKAGIPKRFTPSLSSNKEANHEQTLG